MRIQRWRDVLMNFSGAEEHNWAKKEKKIACKNMKYSLFSPPNSMREAPTHKGGERGYCNGGGRIPGIPGDLVVRKYVLNHEGTC